MKVTIQHIACLLALTVTLSCNKDSDDRDLSANIAPLAMAGADEAYPHPVKGIQLKGKAVDMDGYIVDYSWRKVMGPSGFIMENPDGATTNIDLMEYGIYVFELKVVDNGGLFGLDRVVITVDSLNADPCNGCWDY